jgi:putative transposase
MLKHLKRYYGQANLHFIACSCCRRLPLLHSTRAKNIFAETLGEVRTRYGFALVGYVVMPEHIHLLIGEPARGTPSTVMQILKQRVSHQLRSERRILVAQPRRRFGRSDEALPRLWQLRFYDFNVWSHKKRVEKLDYMHMNPVKRGLVEHPRDWPWSSFSFYSNRKPGLVPIDPIR